MKKIKLGYILGVAGAILLLLQLIDGFVSFLGTLDPIFTIIVIGIIVYFIKKGKKRWRQ